MGKNQDPGSARGWLEEIQVFSGNLDFFAKDRN
jgi:hypothetical protein